MQLHIPSLAVGVAAAAVLLVSMSQSTPSSGPPRIEYGPNPRDMVQIKEGTPFTVPVGKVFVLTGLGINVNQGNAFLYVNNQAELFSYFGAGVDNPCSVAPVASGFTVSAGSTINVVGSGGGSPSPLTPGRAWGYLSDR